MANQVTISLSEFHSDQINGRSAVRATLTEDKDASLVVYDFEGITFLSRSAAHEILEVISESQKLGKQVTLKHLTPQVAEMLDRVEDSKKHNIKTATYVERLQFTSEQELEDFLMTIE